MPYKLVCQNMISPPTILTAVIIYSYSCGLQWIETLQSCTSNRGKSKKGMVTQWCCSYVGWRLILYCNYNQFGSSRRTAPVVSCCDWHLNSDAAWKGVFRLMFVLLIGWCCWYCLRWYEWYWYYNVCRFDHSLALSHQFCVLFPNCSVISVGGECSGQCNKCQPFAINPFTII